MMLPPYEKFPVLTSGKVLMDQFGPGHIKDIVDISFYNSKPATDENEALEMLNKINDDYQKKETVHWGICDKEKNVIVGSCGYYRGFNNETGELGCVLKTEFRGKGYMSIAMKLAIDFGFSTIGLKEIIALTSKKNTKAIQLMERLDFKKVFENETGSIKYVFNKNLWEK